MDATSDKELEDACLKLLDDARTFREAVRSVKSGGMAYNDTWVMIPVERAKKAGIL